MIKCLIRPCVFCQKTQDYQAINQCIQCEHHKEIVFDECGEFCVECDIRGSVMHGKFEPSGESE